MDEGYIDPTYLLEEKLIDPPIESPELTTAEQITLFELTSALNPKTRETFLSENELEIIRLQVARLADHVNLELFIRLCRQEKIRDVFGLNQQRAIESGGFNLDDYAQEGPMTAENVLWKASELFRCWAMTNTRALNAEVTHDQLVKHTGPFTKVFKDIAKAMFPQTDPFDNPFYDPEGSTIPIILNPHESLFIPPLTVRLFINDVCLLVPIPPTFFTYQKHKCYLNHFTQLPLSAPYDQRYQVESVLKIITTAMLLEKLQLPFDEQGVIDPRKIPPTEKIKKAKLPGILTSQIPTLWNTYNRHILIRHLEPVHNFNPEKRINFLMHLGLNPQDIDNINIYGIMDLIEHTIKTVAKEKKAFKHANETQPEYRELPNGTRRRVDKKPKQKNTQKKSSKKRVFQANLPGLNFD